MKKAEFFRLALTTGFLELSKGIVDQSGSGAQAATPRSVVADGRLAPMPDNGLS